MQAACGCQATKELDEIACLSTHISTSVVPNRYSLGQCDTVCHTK